MDATGRRAGDERDAGDSQMKPRAGGRKPLSWAERIFLTLHRNADRYLSPLGVWVMRRTKGAMAKPWKVDVLLLTTSGRRSGKTRTVVLQYFPDGASMVVVAANDGGEAHPGWYFNLKAEPHASVEVMGRTFAVRGVELPPSEAADWWKRIVARAPDYARYARATDRTFPIFRLVPVVAE